MERMEQLQILREWTDAPIHLCVKALAQTDSLLAAGRWLKINWVYMPVDKNVYRLHPTVLLGGLTTELMASVGDEAWCQWTLWPGPGWSLSSVIRAVVSAMYILTRSVGRRICEPSDTPRRRLQFGQPSTLQRFGWCLAHRQRSY